MEAYDAVRQAIEQKLQLVAVYKGKRRYLCPHVLGTKKQKAQALFFQFGGDANSVLPADGEWRCLPLEGLEILELVEGEWYSSEHLGRYGNCIDDVH